MPSFYKTLQSPSHVEGQISVSKAMKVFLCGPDASSVVVTANHRSAVESKALKTSRLRSEILEASLRWCNISIITAQLGCLKNVIFHRLEMNFKDYLIFNYHFLKVWKIKYKYTILGLIAWYIKILNVTQKGQIWFSILKVILDLSKFRLRTLCFVLM